MREGLIVRVLEGARILLFVYPCRQRPALLFQELLRYPGTFFGRDLVSLPAPSFGPLLEEHSALPCWRTEHHQRPARDGEHRADGEVQAVVYAARFVDQEKPHPREASDGLLRAGERDDAAPVLQLEGELALPPRGDRTPEVAVEAGHLAEELLGLP